MEMGTSVLFGFGSRRAWSTGAMNVKPTWTWSSTAGRSAGFVWRTPSDCPKATVLFDTAAVSASCPSISSGPARATLTAPKARATPMTLTRRARRLTTMGISLVRREDRLHLLGEHHVAGDLELAPHERHGSAEFPVH